MPASPPARMTLPVKRQASDQKLVRRLLHTLQNQGSFLLYVHAKRESSTKDLKGKMQQYSERICVFFFQAYLY